MSLVFVAVLGFSAATAGAQSDESYVGGEVQSASAIRPVAAVEPASVASASVSNSALAFTGGDALTLGLIGAGAVVAGGSLLVVRRRADA